MTTAPTSNWQAIAAFKRQTLASKIPAEWRLPASQLSSFSETSTLSALDMPCSCNLLTPRELDITEKYDATALVGLMLEKEMTSVEVVTAFCKRAAVAQQCVNCLTEIMFEEALGRARECDEFLEREGRGMGALHGLPISLKDSFNVKGTHTTIGYVSFINHPPAASNSVVVDMLHRAGAVFYVKTNLPQTMMTADSHNNVFGRTLNPHKLCLTAGGSTGGEGALLAMRGSVLGMATDVAGSNRIPALCNGTSSLKPTAGRIPFAGGVPPGRLGSPSSILPVIGPAGHSVRDYELVMKTVLDAEPWTFDENAINAPWRTVEAATRPLRFGLIRGHAKRPLHPPIARTLHTAATQLKAHGHSVVLLDDQIPDLYENAVLAWKYFLLDPQKTPAKHISASGEPWVPSMAVTSFPELAGWEASLDALFDMNVERAKVLRRYREVFVDSELDAIVMPGYQATAVPHDTFGVPIYTTLANLLNYPAGMLPFLKAEKRLDEPFFEKEAQYEPQYNPDVVEGAPGAIQIMGKPMKDEELVEIMKVVETILAKEN
ncbi:amidase signature domain-containing protein [Massariosphaeria phaeospora]|uniref:Amidase signature domain-containing protein n=1 Tax=Massariosphaeria phaeospora TaxID=100035 RepID=A0A7C8IFL1_9PLEO|nr:amidase signature domain-containing protein [Massariosphaeria phaeospora]